MVWFTDELVREAGTFTSATVIRLTGAAANHIRFRDAKRRDGGAVQSGDRTQVGVFQAGVGFAICSAQLTLGADDTLTLDASKVRQSSAGASLPAFSSSGASADVYIAESVDTTAGFDETGALLNPDLFRNAIAVEKVIAGFLSELGTADKEAVMALGLSAAFDGLGGFFGYDVTNSETADDEDVHENDHTSTGRVLRLNIKPWRTKRSDAIPAGNLLTLFNANTADRLWKVVVWANGGAHRTAALVFGHASDPYVDVLYQYGDLAFELSSTNVGIRNNNGGSLTVRHIKPIFG